MIAAVILSTLTLCSTPGSQQVASPMRIIAMAPSSAEVICALGAEDRLIGISSYVTWPRSLLALPRVGGLHDPSLESIFALDPDLVILRGSSTSLERMCDDHDIRVYRDRTDSLPSIFATIKEMGELLGATEKAEALNRDIRDQLNQIEETAQSDHPPAVLLTLRGPERLANVTTVAGDTYLSELIRIAGGRNVFGDSDAPYPQIRMEEIVARQPDVIIELLPGLPINAEQHDALLAQWKPFESIKAVRDGQIRFITDDYATVPSPRVKQMARRMADIIAAVRSSP